MEKSEVIQALKRLAAESKQRKFKQTVELIVNVKGVDFKKAENRIDFQAEIASAKGHKDTKVAVFCRDKNFASLIKDKCRVIMEDEIPSLDKKAVQELAESYDVLLAEGPVMLAIGKFMGQILAPKGKMPKPIQPDPKQFATALSGMKSLTRITNKKGKFMPLVQVVIGKEDVPQEQLAENVMTVYNGLVSRLPAKQQNVKSVLLKLTMSKPVLVTKAEAEHK